MDDRLLELGLAEQPADAAVDRPLAHRLLALAALDQLRAFDVRAAHRAHAGHRNRTGVRRAALGHHLHHLRDHVAGAADDHRVADHQAQARHFVHVVQGGVGDRHASHLHRLQACHRGHRAGAADLEFHVEQLGELFLRRELVGNGPMRGARPEAQLLLVLDIVDLEHHAIDIVGQARAALADVAVVVQAGLHTPGQLQFAADGHAPGLEPLQHAHLGARQLALHPADAIGAELQRPAGGDLRVELAQAAGGGVARVGEGLAAGFHGAGVERLEAGPGHVHLAAHFQHCRPTLALQAQRDVAHGAHVGADVLAGAAVATGGAAHQTAVLVEQADRQAVELGLAAVFHFRPAAEQVAGRQQLTQALAHAAVEVQQVLFLEGVAQAEHRHFVAHLAEGRGSGAAHALGRRLRGHQFGMRLFQALEFAEQAVVFGVWNARLVEHVVAVVVRVELAAQLRDSLGGGLGIGHRKASGGNWRAAGKAKPQVWLGASGLPLAAGF
ncbi:hypothetical protein D9M71_108690 [compost metagenome]